MPHPVRRRIAGLLLALCLNAAFYAMFAWQLRPGIAVMPDPSRMALVWAAPVVEAPAPSLAAPARASPVNARAPRARQTPLPPIAASDPAHLAEVIIESDASDPFDRPSSATAQSFDKAVVAKAIKVAMAERKALEDTQKFVKSGRGPNQYEQFAANAEEATIPSCLRPDAMKHTPPILEVGPLKIPLAGVLALPFYAKAVATGKCRDK